jgi:membrane associated rhomboid family serine protease
MSDQPPIEDFELEMPEDMDVRHCYRHPDRETGVSCSSCGRPICHECMIPAAVGFHCPECVAEQRRAGGRARVVTRSQTRARWGRTGVPGGLATSVTKTLIAINFAVFVVEVILSHGTIGSVTDQAALRLGALFIPDIVQKHEYWRLITPMFLHAGIFHIGINMLSLYFIGSFFEQLASRGKYLAIYLLSGLAGNVVVLLLAPVASLELGASTAIFGVFGALLAYVYRNRRAYPSQLLSQLVFWMVLNLIITFANTSTVSWQGHIGGLIGGVVTVELLARFGRRDLRAPLDARDAASIAIVLAVLVGLAIWRVQTIVL